MTPTPTPSPTPETDAIILECEESGTFQECVDTLTDFAQRLERERDSALAQLEVAVENLQRLTAYAPDGSEVRDIIGEALRKIQEMKGANE